MARSGSRMESQGLYSITEANGINLSKGAVIGKMLGSVLCI